MNIALWIILIILALILIVAGIVAYRYRQQIQTGWIMWKTFRKFRKQAKAGQKNIEPQSKSTAAASPLARCPKCGKWTPQEEAVKIKNNYFCSHTCMEESFKTAA